MSTDDQPAGLTGARQYQIVAVTALLVMALPLLARGLGAWAFLPLIMGVGAGLLKWRTGPYLVLLSIVALVVFDALRATPFDLLAGCFMIFERGRPPPGSFEGARRWKMEGVRPLYDVVLAAGLLGYVIAVFRLMSVQQNILPIDPRRRVAPARRRQRQRARHGAPLEVKRAETDVRPSESLTILLSAVAGAVAALVFGRWLLERNAADDLATLQGDAFPMDVHQETWQLLVLLAVVGVGLLVTSGLLAYVGMTRMSAEEAQLYLQDQLWKETRREQSRLNRWLTWARLQQRGRAPQTEVAPPRGERR